MKIVKSPSLREYFSRDQGELPPFLRELFAAVPAEVVQPETAAEIIDVVRVAQKNGTPLVPRGAGSTAFGQVVPAKSGLLLDLNFYKAVRRFDRGRGLVTVESGIRWSDLDAFLEPRGWALGSYPSSWYSTVGGWIATGGYGIGSLKFGPIKDQVAELWVCAGDGRDIRLKPGEPKFDAFFETEGQMGVVLEVTLKVRPRPASQTPVLLSFATLPEAWVALNRVLEGRFDLFHASVYNRERMQHFDKNLEEKMRRKGGTAPSDLKFGAACGVLLVVEDGTLYPSPPLVNERREAGEALPPPIHGRRGGEESAVVRLKEWARAQGWKVEPDYKASFVWSERSYPLKGKKQEQMFLGNEVMAANARAAAYCADLEKLGAAEDLHLAVEGEVAGKDKSLVLASFYAPAAEPVRYARGLAAVFQMDRLGVRRHGGTLYHVGIYNTPFLARKFTRERLAALRAAKASLDPARVFNPGKFFELTTAKTGWLPSWANLLGARVLIAVLGTPGLGPLLAGLAGPWLGKTKLTAQDRVLRSERECVDCGFCLPVCPAFLATRDERTTARGKLHLFARWTQGQALSSEDVELLHSCMHCAGCTSVCQSTLDLVPVWDELEARVARDFGRPTRAIVDFVKAVEESDDYRRLLRQGTITEFKPAGVGPRVSEAGEGAQVKIDSGRGRG